MKNHKELLLAIAVLMLAFAVALWAGWYGDPRYQG